MHPVPTSNPAPPRRRPTLALVALAAALLCGPTPEARAQAISPAHVDLLEMRSPTQWEGLASDRKVEGTSDFALLWPDTITNDRIQSPDNLALDMSGWNGVELLVHSGKATGADIAFVLVSENPATADGEDYYLARFKVNWVGWQLVPLPFESMRAVREPLGPQRITRIKLASSRYGIETTDPETVLHLDAIRPLGATPRDAVPGIGSPAVTWKAFTATDLEQLLEQQGQVAIYARTGGVVLCEDFEKAYLSNPAEGSLLAGKTHLFFDTETSPMLSRQFNVYRVPTVIVLQRDGPERRLTPDTGTSPAEIVAFLAGKRAGAEAEAEAEAGK
jgi:hypothetical protein